MYPLKGLLIYPLPVVHYSFAPHLRCIILFVHAWMAPVHKIDGAHSRLCDC